VRGRHHALLRIGEVWTVNEEHFVVDLDDFHREITLAVIPVRVEAKDEKPFLPQISQINAD